MTLEERDDIEIVVLFNAAASSRSFALDAAGHARFRLHQALRRSGDPVVRRADYDRHDRTFHVPARTTAVFVARPRRW